MLCLGLMQLINAQQKETALTTIGGMKVKINLNSATSLATITMVGPSSKWLSIGLSTSDMATNKDVMTYGTTLLDQYFTSNGHVAPTTDATNNLTVVSNTVAGTTRTIVFTRPFSTGDAKDYTFVLYHDITEYCLGYRTFNQCSERTFNFWQQNLDLLSGIGQ